MSAYLLDTNAVFSILNSIDSPVAKKLKLHSPNEIYLCSIVIHELFYGAFKSQRATQNVALVDHLLFPVLAFDKEDARQAGEIRAHLALNSNPIGPYDILIAGQAKARQLTLVTNNLNEFKRVQGLQVESWL